jgi:cell division protein FtsI/penicillin-binding protein 2
MSPSNQDRLAADLKYRRARGLGLMLAAAFCLVGLSEVRLQAVEAKGILKLARKSNHFVLSLPQPARRGTIFTADGQALAEDSALSRLTLTFKNLPRVPGFYADLAVATGIPESQLEAASEGDQAATASGKKAPKSVEWDLPLSAEQAAAVATVRSRWNAGGLGIERDYGRRYPLGMMAAGFVGRLREKGKTDGLEAHYDKDLTGVNGVKVGMTDRGGSFLPTRVSSESREAFDGASVETTIDSTLQIAASQAVREAVEAHDADAGAAIILDPRTGDILAVANWPTYDPQPIPGAAPLPKSSDLDLAYMGAIEPGSMLKALTLAKLLDSSGMPKPVECKGQIEVGGHLIRCADHAGKRAHGNVSADEAIIQSCNVSAAIWGMSIKTGPFYKYMKQLGLLDTPGLGLKGERSGNARENPAAPVLEVANWGFGQSVVSTPLAIADAISCLANDGMRMKLRLVRRVGGTEYPPQSAGQMVSAKSANTVLRYMEGVISEEHGTGHTLRIPGYRLAGKTGTAQIANKGGKYISNFVGFVPAQKPVAEILVMIQRPRKGGYYGAAIAGPAFQNLAYAVIRRYGIAPTEPMTEDKQKKVLAGSEEQAIRTHIKVAQRKNGRSVL